MHVRLTAVLLAGMVAFAGSGVSPSRNAAEAPLPPSVIPAIDGFDNLRPTAPPSAALAQQERVTLTTRPIPRPASRSEHVVTRADLDRTGVLVAAYRAAAKEAPGSCNLPVALLAAIGQIESGSAGGRQIGPDHVVRPGIFGPLLDGGPFAAIRDSDGGSYDGDRTWDRAVGPMQFIPSTWAWAGVDGDGDGKADPQNVYDAAHSAAGYLCRYGRDLAKPEDMRAAIWSYNQSTDYVAAVLEWTSYFNGKGLEAVGSVGFQVASGGRASLLPAVRSSAPSSSSTSSATAAERTVASRTSPTATATPTPRTTTATPKPVTTTPTSSPTTTATPTPTTTTGTPSATSTTGTTSPTATTTTSPTGETTTTASPTTSTPACPSPTATVTVTPTPTTTTPSPTTSTATPTTSTPTASPTTCSATATVTATPTATASTSTTAATEGS